MPAGMAGESFRDLRVWRESMMLVGDEFLLCASFPKEERFGLAAQLKRAVVSIPSNIAEGARRRRRLPFLFHLEVALGSQAEVEVQLEIANQLGLVDESRYAAVQERARYVGRMLTRLIDQLRSQ